MVVVFAAAIAIAIDFQCAHLPPLPPRSLGVSTGQANPVCSTQCSRLGGVCFLFLCGGAKKLEWTRDASLARGRVQYAVHQVCSA